MTEADVRKLLDKRIRAGGLRAFCREHDLDPGHTSRVQQEGAKLSPAILDALGLEVASVETLYRRKRK